MSGNNEPDDSIQRINSTTSYIIFVKKKTKVTEVQGVKINVLHLSQFNFVTFLWVF